MAASSTLIKALAVTAELCGRAYTPEAAALLAADLDGFGEQAVLAALTRCRKELDGRPLTVAAIIARVDDGRPGPQEAWAMMPTDESMSVVWTEEMCQAWGAAAPLLDGRGNVAARMAFIEAYTRALTAARDRREPAHWTASLGHDQHGRERALTAAIAAGRMSIEHARTMLPQLDAPTPRAQQLLAQVNIRSIPA